MHTSILYSRLFFAALILVLLGMSSHAQVNTTKLNSVKSEDYTDQQLLSFLSQADAAKLSDDEMVQYAMAQGLPASEVEKFMDRINRLRKNQPNKNNKTSRASQTKSGRTYNSNDLSLRDTVPPEPDSLSIEERMQEAMRRRVFGASIFTGKGISFEPNLRLATPANYQIGPDDEILITLYGNSEADIQAKVTPEGTIKIPYVGVVPVAGITMEQATARIKMRMSTIYSALKTGQTKLSVTLGNIRTIKVTITGQVATPGTYSLSSLATAANALYFSGGPTLNGSFRDIQLIRGGKKIATLDVYDFLMNGAYKNDIRLRDQDVIRVPTYVKRVEITGEVKQPFIFELLPGEKFSDLLRYAGGFTNNAYTARIRVYQSTGTQRRIAEVTSDRFDEYEPTPGDLFIVQPIMERFENRVTITGAVNRAGEYQLDPGLTLKGLITKAEGLREDAFRNRVNIYRLKDNLQVENIAVDLDRVLNGQVADIPLKREDQVIIMSIDELKESYTVQIDGEVQRPGTYTYAEGMTVQDLILRAGGLKESASNSRIEIASRVKNSNALSTSAQTSVVLKVDVNSDLKTATREQVLNPFDIVSVRVSPGYEVQRVVRIDGEVLYPGNYTLEKKDERISDIIRRAGGLTSEAYPAGASLRRLDKRALDLLEHSKDAPNLQKKNEEFQRLRGIKTITTVDSAAAAPSTQASGTAENYVGIDLSKILTANGGQDDIFMEDGDVLNVPKQLQTVTVNGQVLSPRTVIYSKRMGFLDYISGAGGFGDKAKKRNSYVQYANGAVRGTKRFLFFTNYPPIKPGTEIYVPQKPEKRGLTATEIVGLTSGVASLGAIILGIINLSK